MAERAIDGAFTFSYVSLHIATSRKRTTIRDAAGAGVGTRNLMFINLREFRVAVVSATRQVNCPMGGQEV